MKISKRNLSIASSASALTLIAFTGVACAQETGDKAYDNHAADTQKMESTVDHQNAMAAQRKDEVNKAASSFGVDELNDIENWKITNGGAEIGEIDRLGVDRKTGELLAVVGLKGVVGVNMKEVAVPLKHLKKAGDETLSTDLTKTQLQQKRDIDPWDGSYSQLINSKATQ